MNSNDRNAQEIFGEALDIADPVERSAYVDRSCAGDAALRQEVESLLAANSAAANFLGQPAVGTAQKTMFIPTLSETTGTRIGRYKLLERIGEGGFGVVWMAEQEEPVRRRVALKVIKLGMDTKEVVARFEAERQALAMMDHPNIASVFDGGATDTGRPYFVMELVKGVPITDYCDANKFSTAQRLELFMRVCHAVQHAHQKGIIHRDLKPSNILVTVKDDQPVPKVIDFGVAKATQARLTERTMFTHFRQLIGTPAYMSPEQAGFGSLDVDTRSDIYSLGVLLYELLTGKTPFDTAKLLEKGYDAVMRTIREEEPPKPSTRLSTLNREEVLAIAAKRGAEPAKLNRIVHGDLDWIVMKALEKDRKRRYEMPSTLAADLQAHLLQKPVSAAAPGLLYVSGKFVRRNRARLAFATLGCVATLLAAAGIKIAMESRAKDRAFLASGTNAVFALAKSGDADALARLLDANPRLVRERDWDGSTPLAYAAAAGATNTLALLVSRGAVIDATNRSGLTALGNAAANNQAAALAILLEAGADPNHSDAAGATPLHSISLFGSVEMGKALLAKGARVDAVALTSHVTAIHQAAMLGYADFVELLAEHGARLDLVDAAGNMPLHTAASGKTAEGTIREWQQKLATQVSAGAQGRRTPVAAQEFSNRLARIELLFQPAVKRAGGNHRRVAELLIAHGARVEATNHDVCTPLLTAALFTNLPVAEVLIAHKASLNVRAKDGSTPLNLVALKGSVPIAELLVKAGATKDLSDEAGFTPLNTAIEQGQPEVARFLLLSGADANRGTKTGQTPMHTAAAHGDIESMRLLLEHGATLHPLEISGSPLAVAVQHNQIEAVKLLLQRGAKPDVSPPQNGMTALHWAATLGRAEMVKLLLAAGAIVNADSSWQGTPLNAAAAGRKSAEKWLASLYVQADDGAKLLRLEVGSDADYLAVLHALLDAKADVNSRELRFNRTPIFAAISLGHARAVEILLNASADLKVRDRLGMSPLHATCEMEEVSPLVVSNIVRQLLNAGADIEARDQFRGTPLHAAANAGKPVIASLLIEAGARVNAIGPNFCTPLQLAVMRGRRDVVDLLLHQQPDLEWRNSYGTTALQQAAQLQARDLAVLLLDHGAEVDYPDINGATALMVSASVGDVDAVKLLLQRGARIDAVNTNGYTPFLIAAQEGKVESAHYLLEQGAQFDVRDRDGFTPLILAARGGHLEMVKFLLDHGAKIDARNKVNFTALHEAADRGHAKLVEFLLGQHAELEPRDDYEATPLHVAAHGAFTDEAQYVRTVKVLIAHGANVNDRMRRNQTPLHRAADWGRSEILAALLAAGADPALRDADGKTALDIAKDANDPRSRPGVLVGRKKCVAVLLEFAGKTVEEGSSERPL